MSTRSVAAPSKSWSLSSVEPTIDATAVVHDFAAVMGNVRIAENVLVAPGASIRASHDAVFRIGSGAAVQDGVVIQALGEGRVLGDDDQSYAVWIGRDACIAHKAIIQGPVYIGDEAFVGFRSTVFNARLGPGCLVMMHALVQDVEIPPGKVVPSGAVITQQSQADRLADATAQDLAFVNELTTISQALRTGYGQPTVMPTQSANAAADFRDRPPRTSIAQDNGTKTMQPQRLTTDIVQQVRQLLHQGYKIGTEHADTRRYRSNVWQTCSPIQSTREGDVLTALEDCLGEHNGEYVRMFGIDPVANRRVASTTIQRPDGKAVHVESRSVPHAHQSHATSSASGGSTSLVSADLGQQVRAWLSQGYNIGLEHADARRFRSNVWQSCSPVRANNEREVMGALDACMNEHQGEYVRMFGIDPKAKRRVSPVIIQRPDGRADLTAVSHTNPSADYNSYSNGYSNGQNTPATNSGHLASDVVQRVRAWLSQGFKIGTEHADGRRFRSNVWQTCSPIESTRDADVLAALDGCVQQHAGEYVRMFGINPTAKTRLEPVIIQRPGQSYDDASFNQSYQQGYTQTSGPGQYHREPPVYTTAKNYQTEPPVYNVVNGSGSQPLSDDVVQQVRQLVGQGYRISLEHADIRRYRSGAWQNGGVIEGHNPSAVLSALETGLASHSGQYVRLVGVDPQAKRRVLETTIQRP